jgi:hypothetical protein
MENVFICEAQDLVAHTFQPVLSCYIFCLLGGFLMITTINFYNQLLLKTNKIDYIVAYYMLSSKSRPKFLLSLMIPQKFFCIGHLRTILFRILLCSRI